MPRKLVNILVTGGLGFIGSNFIQYLFRQSEFKGKIINLDVVTYAGNPENLQDTVKQFPDQYVFVKGDIRDRNTVQEIFKKYDIDTVVHFAAESHVDRSISGPEAFISTNVLGTFTLLDVARTYWEERYGSEKEYQCLFHHISTDEVYGSLGESGYFNEDTPYDPRSPYSASKASSDHLVMAYHHTFHFPITLTNCSNNYGPYQFPEKLIPLMILNMIESKALPVYGDGKNIRDWLYVEDHNSAVWMVMNKGHLGEKYNIGGENEWENITLLKRLIKIVSEQSNIPETTLISLINYVKDRPGHDRRYAIDCSKIKKQLGWKQSVSFEEGLRKTVLWYLENKEWCDRIKSGQYKKWLIDNYENR
ncbi:MAG: dTDP-glucose 4,6-dehydratase [Mobilitalea sp.]